MTQVTGTIVYYPYITAAHTLQIHEFSLTGQIPVNRWKLVFGLVATQNLHWILIHHNIHTTIFFFPFFHTNISHILNQRKTITISHHFSNAPEVKWYGPSTLQQYPQPTLRNKHFERSDLGGSFALIGAHQTTHKQTAITQHTTYRTAFRNRGVGCDRNSLRNCRGRSGWVQSGQTHIFKHQYHPSPYFTHFIYTSFHNTYLSKIFTKKYIIFTSFFTDYSRD